MDVSTRQGAAFMREGEHIKTRMASLAEEYPEYCFLAEVAKALGLSKRTVDRCHKHKIKHIEVDGVTMYDRKAVRHYVAVTRFGKGGPSVLRLNGIDVERMRTIAETYYRQNLDTAPPHLLKLAKKVARL